MLNSLAHAGEVHAGVTESTGHLLESAVYVILLWIVLMAIGYLLASRMFKLALSVQLIFYAAINLLLGSYLHDKHQALGALIVSLGFVLILLQVVNGLSVSELTNSKTKAKKKPAKAK